MYKRQEHGVVRDVHVDGVADEADVVVYDPRTTRVVELNPCLLYTSDAADERSSVDLGGRRIIKKKKK